MGGRAVEREGEREREIYVVRSPRDARYTIAGAISLNALNHTRTMQYEWQLARLKITVAL